MFGFGAWRLCRALCFQRFSFLRGKRIQIGSYAKARVYVRISSYSSAYKMSEEDFEQPYYENHMN